MSRTNMSGAKLPGAIKGGSISTGKLPDHPSAGLYNSRTIDASPDNTDRYNSSMKSPELKTKVSQIKSPSSIRSGGVKAAPSAYSDKQFSERYHTNPILFYFTRDVNVRQLKYFDTELDQNLQQMILFKNTGVH